MTMFNSNTPCAVSQWGDILTDVIICLVMAYMEMFGNCSHPPNAPGAAAPPDMFRHSIHTYNIAR